MTISIATLGVNLDTSDLKKGEENLKRVQREGNKTADSLEGAGKRGSRGLESIVAAATRVSAAVAALGVSVGLGSALREFASFEQGLRNVGSVAGATTEQMEMLESAALRAAASTRFDPAQTTQALYALASAGQDVASQIQTLPNVLNLAEAAQADLGQTTELLTATLAQYRLGADQSQRVADVFTASIGASALNVDRLQVSFRNAGPTAAALNQSLEGTTAVLGTLTSAFGNGERAGTGLRAILNELPSQAEALGVAIYGADGAMRPFVEILDDIEASGFTGAQAVREFGAEAGPALAALLSSGSDALRQMESRIAANGQAADVAGKQLDTLAGDYAGFVSAATVALVGVGDAQSGFARDTLQMVTNLIRLWSGYGDTLGDARESTERLAASIEAVGFAGLAVVVGQVSAAFGAKAAAVGRAALVTAAHTAAIAENARREAEGAVASLAAARASEARALAEVNSTRAVVASVRAEIELEKVRLRAQITDVGRAATIERMAAASTTLASANRLLLSTETALAGATAATAAAQTASAAATARATTAVAAASVAGKALAGVLTVVRGALALVGGPIGAVVVGLTALVLWFNRARDAAGEASGAAVKSISEMADEAERLRSGGPLLAPEQINAVDDAQEKIRGLANVMKILEEQRQAAVGRGDTFGATQIAVEMNNVAGAIEKTANDIRRLNEAVKPVPIVLGETETAATAAADAIGNLSTAEADRLADLQEQIAFQTRINELMRDGRTESEARFVAEFEAADALTRQLMVQQQVTEGLANAQNEAARAATATAEANKRAQEEAATAAQRAADETAAAAQRMRDELNRGITDGILRGFEAGKGFVDNFVDVLKAQFQALVLRPTISFIVSGIQGAISQIGGAAFSSLTGGGGIAGLLGGAGGGIGSAIFNGTLPLIDAIGNTFPTLASSLTNLSASLTALSPGMLALGAAGAAGLFAVGRGLAVDNSRVGENVQGAAAVLNPLSLVASGLDRITGGGAFGTKFRTVGQELTLSVEDGVIESMLWVTQSRKRSGFRGRKWRAWSEEFNTEIFQAAFDSLAETAGQAARLAGTGLDLSATIQRDIFREENGAQLAFDDLATVIAERIVPGIRDFSREGETVANTFARITAQAQGLDAGLMGLNTSLSGVALFEQAERLNQVFGDQLPGSMSSLQSVLLTSDQQFENLRTVLSGALGEVGVALTDSRENLLGVVQGLDLTTESGIRAYEVLLAAAPQLGQFFDTLETRAEATDRETEARNKSLGSLRDQIAVMRSADPEIEQMNQRFRDLRAEAGDDKAILALIESLYGLEAAAIAAARAEANRQAEEARYQQSRGLLDQIALMTSLDPEMTRLEQKFRDLRNEAGQDVGLIELVNRLSELEVGALLAARAAETAAAAQQSMADAISAAQSRVSSAEQALEQAQEAQRNAQVAVLNEQIEGERARFAVIQEGIRNQLAAETASINARIAGARDVASASQAVVGLLGGAASSVAGLSLTRAQALSNLQNIGSGRLSVTPGLERSVSAAQQFEPDEFASQIEMAAAQSLTAETLARLAGRAEKQLTSDERSVELLEQSLTDAQARADRQLAVAEAYHLVNVELIEEQIKQINGTLTAVQALDAANQAAAIAQHDLDFARNELARISNSAANQQLARLAQIDDSTRALYLLARDSDSASIPGFASGGMFSGGLRVVGENGPELEATGPARIWNQQQIAAAVGGSSGDPALRAEVAALRREVASLTNAMTQTARNTARSANTLDRVETQGIPVQVIE